MDFDALIERRQTKSLKWCLYDHDVIPLWVADMDFRCPQVVLDALKDRVDQGILGYDLPPDELAPLIVERMKRLYNWDIALTDVSFVPGCVTGFNLALRAYCQPGDAVLVQTPVYPPFLSAPQSHQLRRIDNPLREMEGGRCEVDYDLFEEQIIREHGKLFILCNPHNPVGRVFTRNELQRMAEICAAHDVLICSDDIHCDLIFDGFQHIPMASTSLDAAHRTITLIAPSKTFNIAGLHASVMIIQDDELKERMCSARKGLVGNPGSLSLVAALAAYQHGQPWLEEALAYLEANRDWLAEQVAAKMPGIRMFKPEGTFLAWLDCRQLPLPGDPYHFFLENARVGLNNGLEFGEEGRGFVRFNFASPRSLLEEALKRMRQALHSAGVTGY